MTTLNSDFLSPAPAEYKWPQCPEAERFVREQVDMFLAGHPFARRLAERMMDETSTEFLAWVDHVVLPASAQIEQKLAKAGFVRDNASVPANVTPYWHPFADLPRVLLAEVSAPACAIMVENIRDFLLAHGLSLAIDGSPFGAYREARLAGPRGELRIVERRGGRGYVPDREERASRYFQALEAWLNRPRHFPSRADGMKSTLALAERLVREMGAATASWIFLEAERCYWQSRNRAGQTQKVRQDRLGLGWANHDHHTFRSGRPSFPALIKILQAFGFKKRERYYAGSEAGWGAQIMEQPESRLIIFADVDLAPDEVMVDFPSVALPELPKPGTVGLWCALHGESMLEAGMHHLEAKFDFDHMRDSLKDFGISFMNPFSDFPYLRQAFSEGEWWPVPAARLDALLASHQISQDVHDRILQKGAVGSHLENLQRRNGFKGFNQKGVSQIIREVNPEAQAMKQSQGPAA